MNWLSKQVKIRSHKKWWNETITPNWKGILAKFFSPLGGIWMITEPAMTFFKNSMIETFVQSNGVIIAISTIVSGIIFTLPSLFPKTKFKEVIRETDIIINIIIGDIFRQKGNIVVPINNKFDVDIKHQNASVQSRFVDRLGGIDNTSTIIRNKLTTIDNQPTDGSYEIGTTICIDSPNNNVNNKTCFYLLAMSKLNTNNHAESNINDIEHSLVEFWNFLAKNGQHNITNIPLIGGGHGRANVKKEEIIKSIIDTFINAVQTHDSKFIPELNIVIYYNDYKSVNMTDIIEYCKLKCKHTKKFHKGRAVSKP